MLFAQSRFVMMLFAILALLGALMLPVAASAQTQSDVQRCRQGGWVSLARAESPSVAFTSQDECDAYGALGGTIVDLDERQLFLVGGLIETFLATRVGDGTLHGTGFAPGSTITSIAHIFDGQTWYYTTAAGQVVDSDGAFVAGGDKIWCGPWQDGYPTLTFAITDSLGETYTQTFDLESHCS